MAVLTMRELRELSARLQREAFARDLGPFALIQRPPDPGRESEALRLGARSTLRSRRGQGPDAHEMLFSLNELVIATLPPMVGAEDQALVIGRLPDCDLVVDDPSVSKRHARLVWEPARGDALLADLESSNGTFLNGAQIGRAEVQVNDGDVIGFGDVTFLFLFAQTLLSRLRRMVAPE